MANELMIADEYGEVLPSPKSTPMDVQARAEIDIQIATAKRFT
jgi:hypothetical protein